MPRPIWSGSISFGLVNIPVRLHGATKSHRIAFHEYDEGSGQRIRLKRVTEASGREISWKKIVKGFEVAKGRHVVLSDEELAAAAPEKTRTIEIEQFVQLNEIDPVSWDQTYFVVPDGTAAARAYALFREALAKSGRVAIGRFVMRTKEYVVCLRPFEEVIALQTMFYPDEIRNPKDLGELPRKPALKANELALANRLIDGLSAPWDPSTLRDTYRDRVMKLVAKKAQGQEIITEQVAVAEEGHGEKPIVDLMAALKATLAANETGGAPTARRPARRARRGKAAGAKEPTPRTASPAGRRPPGRHAAGR
ncbi:MAG TPA: Ku protein [Polyangia bacterium]|jgi:DNA end-binding protein Ku|nr:Ku protein [Polyangia bacterium]